jgi:hypothetical protein
MNYGFQDIRGDNIVDLSVLYDDPLKSSLDVNVTVAHFWFVPINRKFTLFLLRLNLILDLHNGKYLSNLCLDVECQEQFLFPKGQSNLPFDELSVLVQTWLSRCISSHP